MLLLLLLPFLSQAIRLKTTPMFFPLWSWSSFHTFICYWDNCHCLLIWHLNALVQRWLCSSHDRAEAFGSLDTEIDFFLSCGIPSYPSIRPLSSYQPVCPVLIWMRNSKAQPPFVTTSLVLPSRRIESQSLLSPLHESLTARPSPRILPWTASPPITHQGSRLRNLPYVSWNTTAIQERMIERNVRWAFALEKSYCWDRDFS